MSATEIAIVFMFVAVVVSRFSLELSSLSIRPEHIALGLVAVLLLLWVVRGRAKLVFSRADWLLVAYLAVTLYSSLVNPPEPRESLKFLGLMVLAIGFYFLLRALLNGDKTFRFAVKALLVVGVAEAIYSLLAWLIYPLGVDLGADVYALGPRGPGGVLCLFSITMHGTDYEPNILGSFLMAVGLVLATMFLSPRLRARRSLIAIGLVIILTALAVNTSRAALVGFAVGLALLFIVSDERNWATKLKWGALAMVFMGVVIVGSFELSHVLMRLPTAPGGAARAACDQYIATGIVNPASTGAPNIVPASQSTLATATARAQSQALTRVAVRSQTPPAVALSGAASRTPARAATPAPTVIAQPLDRLLQGQTVNYRLSTYFRALNDWAASPWFGNGANAFAQKYVTSSFTPGWISNMTLMALHDSGIVGFALLLAWLVWFVWDLVRGLRNSRRGVTYVLMLGLTIGFVGLFVAYQFTTALWLGFTWLYLGLLKSGTDLLEKGAVDSYELEADEPVVRGTGARSPFGSELHANVRAWFAAYPIVWVIIVAVAIILVGLFVFAPGLNAFFTSDSYVFLELARASTNADILGRFVPNGYTWYRPLTQLLFQLEYLNFGLRPNGYHLVALAFHLASVILLYLVALFLTHKRLAAALAAFTFLLTIHAHEVIFDIADIHNALGGFLLLLTIYLYMRGAKVLAVLTLTLNLLADETGSLTVMLLVLYELTVAVKSYNRSELRAAAIRIVPFALVIAAYFGLRLLIGGGVYSKYVACRTVSCIAVGMMEYLNRLFVRPEQLLALVWDNRPLFAIGVAAVLVLIAVLLQIWRWRNWRVIVFGLAWVASAILFFIFSVWPYISDRFLYIVDTGLALLVAGATANVIAGWQSNSRVSHAGAVLCGLGLLVWIVMGAGMLQWRGRLWFQSGAEAGNLIQSIHRQVPNPPPDTTFAFTGVPDSYYLMIAPGNTGPYLFRKGLDSALRISYGRADLRVVEDWTTAAPGSLRNPIYFQFTPGKVVRAAGPTP